MRTTRTLQFRAAFTFVELMIGIVVSSIVLCALAVFTFGVGECWQNSDSVQSAFLAADMGVNRLNRIIRSSQEIDPHPTSGSLDNTTAPAACMLWTDTNGDGAIQYCEMILLKYDPLNSVLAEYSIPSTASNATTTSASLMTASAFLALPNLAKVNIVHDISACQMFALNAGSTSVRPSIEFILNLSTTNGSSQTTVYSTASLRAPD